MFERLATYTRARRKSALSPAAACSLALLFSGCDSSLVSEQDGNEERKLVTLPAVPVATNEGRNWEFCANEGDPCNVSYRRTVKFGTWDQFEVKYFDSPADCSVATFGRDPAPDQTKWCFVDANESSPPPTDPPPTDPPPTDPPPTDPPPATGTYTVRDGVLLDPCGQKVVLRGVNKMIWGHVGAASNPNPGGKEAVAASFQQIATTGANSVRIATDMARPLSETDYLLNAAVQAKLVPIWELHDATGEWSLLDQIADYWTRADVVALAKKYRGQLIVNIANEAGALDDLPGQEVGWGEQNYTLVSQARIDAFGAKYVQIVSRLRAAGLDMPLMVDAFHYGRDISTLLASAPGILNADPLQSVMFSWHIYDQADWLTTAVVTAKMEEARSKKIALVIGELSSNSTPGEACGQPTNWQHIISEAQRLELGYLPWSWDNMNGDCDNLDGSGFSPFDLVADGINASTVRPGFPQQIIYDHPASIRNTSQRTPYIETLRCQ